MSGVMLSLLYVREEHYARRFEAATLLSSRFDIVIKTRLCTVEFAECDVESWRKLRKCKYALVCLAVERSAI